MDRRDNPQGGSSSVIAIACVGALSSLFIVQSKISRENANTIQKSKIENLSQDNERNVINGISVAKALLSPRREGGAESIPTLVATNYYDTEWKLTKAKNKTGSFELVDPRKFAVSLPYLIAPDSKQIASIMAGGQSFFGLKQANEIEFSSVKTNFDPSRRKALSIDVQVKPKGKRITNARINLAPVAPTEIKFQYRKEGESGWKSIPGSLGPGTYEFRVLASGIAFDGVAYLNGTKISEFGGFDDESGEIRHKAVSYSSIDEEMVRFTRSFNINREYNSASCQMIPETGSYELSMVVNSPSGTEETSKSLSVSFNVAAPPPKTLSYDEYMSSCKKQCPYLAPPEEAGLDRVKYEVRDRDGEWAKENFGDYTAQHYRDTKRFELNVPDVRLCLDDRLLAKEFKKRHGRYYVSNADYYSFPDYGDFGKYESFLGYAPPECKREFLFVRDACGCFDSSTRIRLGNNQDEKAISELTSDDTVWNPVLKKAFPIRKMVRGPEKIPMIRITTAERSISVTRNHPMLTPQGVIAAFELSESDKVKMDGDSWSSVTQVSEIPFEGEEPIVWNLELESASDDDDSHFVLANGMVTGDLFIQKKIEGEKK